MKCRYFFTLKIDQVAIAHSQKNLVAPDSNKNLKFPPKPIHKTKLQTPIAALTPISSPNLTPASRRPSLVLSANKTAAAGSRPLQSPHKGERRTAVACTVAKHRASLVSVRSVIVEQSG